MKAGYPVLSLVLAVSLTTSGPVFGQSTVDLEGVWSTSSTVRQDDAYEVADYGCLLGCPAAAYQHLRELLDDPRNDARPFEELMLEAWGYAADRFVEILTPKGRELRDQIEQAELDRRRVYLDTQRAAVNEQRCGGGGFLNQTLSTLPLEVSQLDDRVVFRYDASNDARTIYLDGRDHPGTLQPTRLGHSIGYYDGSTLVVETTGLTSGRFFELFGGGGYSDQLITRERYTRSDDGRIMHLELTLEDPEMFAEPLIYEKVWRYTPDVELLEPLCETVLPG